MKYLLGPLLALALILTLAACAAPPGSAVDVPPIPTLHRASAYIVNPVGMSNVEQAHEQLEAEGNRVYLILISHDSPGAQELIYWDLQARQIRATTGPDEGIDTSALSCYPDCVFVRREDAGSLTVETWTRVLRHEYRHIEQVRNNPELAHDFRSPDSRFTPYAAFMEACADYGLNVKYSYHAQERIDALKQTLGPAMDGILDRACKGDLWAYRLVHDTYDRPHGGSGAFEQLFPSYD